MVSAIRQEDFSNRRFFSVLKGGLVWVGVAVIAYGSWRALPWRSFELEELRKVENPELTRRHETSEGGREMIEVSQVLGLVAAMGLMTVVGVSAMRLVGGLAFSRGWLRCLVGLWVGQGVLTFLIWIAGMLGVPMEWAGVIFCAAAFGGLWMLRSKGRVQDLEENGEEIVENGQLLGKLAQARRLSSVLWWVALAVGTVWVLVLGASLALVSPVADITGLGNWLYKARLLDMGGAWPRDFFEYARPNRHVGYPPGFPLLIAWCAWFMGGLDWYAIRVLPLLLLAGGFLLSATAMRGGGLRNWVGLMALIVLFSGFAGRTIIYSFFAEPLLLFGLGAVLVTLREVLERKDVGWRGLLLVLGPLCWVKQEGAVLASLLVVAVWLATEMWQRRDWGWRLGAGLGIVALVWVLPWRVWVWVKGVEEENFSLGRIFAEGSGERVRQAMSSYWESGVWPGMGYGGAYWLFRFY